jgi:hypothetical protein
MNNLESMSAAVIEVIDGYPVGHQFHGNELKDDVVRIYPESQHQYVDTILRMARRHRRGAFRVVDRNNSLYEKIPYKSVVEQIREVAPKEKQPERKPGQAMQGLLFTQVFFFVFFSVFGFEAAFALGPGPLLSHCFRYSISSSVKSNIALTPMYRFGTYPCLFNLCLAASDDIPPSPLVFSKRFAISSVVYSIPSNIDPKDPPDQGGNVKKSDIWTNVLYNSIVKYSKNSKISFRNLDIPLGRVYIVNMSDIRTNKERHPEAPVAERHPMGAKGER